MRNSALTVLTKKLTSNTWKKAFTHPVQRRCSSHVKQPISCSPLVNQQKTMTFLPRYQKYFCSNTKMLTSNQIWFSSMIPMSHRRFFAHDQTKDTFGKTGYQNLKQEQNIGSSSRQLRADVTQAKNVMRSQMEEMVEKENIWTIPNLLCVSRIVMTPILCGMVLNGSHLVAVGMFTIAGFTDLIDGAIARSFPSQASRIGSFLDPLADKILIASLYLTLTYTGAIPALLTAGIVGRDVLIVIGASYIRYKSIPYPKTLARYFDATYATAQLSPTTISKFNTVIQIGLIAATLAAPVFCFQDHYSLELLWYITGASTFLSGCSYIVYSKETYKILSDSKKDT